MLESMTKNDRHQVLLDTLIAQLIALLQRDKSRKFIAQQIVRWLESEHPLKAKILPLNGWANIARSWFLTR